MEKILRKIERLDYRAEKKEDELYLLGDHILVRDNYGNPGALIVTEKNFCIPFGNKIPTDSVKLRFRICQANYYGDDVPDLKGILKKEIDQYIYRHMGSYVQFLAEYEKYKQCEGTTVTSFQELSQQYYGKPPWNHSTQFLMAKVGMSSF